MVELARELRKRPTPAEKLLWARLRMRQLKGLKFRRQHPIGPYLVDFYCAALRLVVEIDGGYHQECLEQDAERSAYLRDEGYCVVRFDNRDVLENLEGVMKRIGDLADGGSPSPAAPLPPRERGARRAESAGGPSSPPLDRDAGMREAPPPGAPKRGSGLREPPHPGGSEHGSGLDEAPPPGGCEHGSGLDEAPPLGAPRRGSGVGELLHRGGSEYRSGLGETSHPGVPEQGAGRGEVPRSGVPEIEPGPSESAHAGAHEVEPGLREAPQPGVPENHPRLGAVPQPGPSEDNPELREVSREIGLPNVPDSQQTPRDPKAPSPQGGEGWGEGDSLLSSLGLTPEHTLSLSGNAPRSFLSFLIRWQQFDDVHACLDVLIPRNPTHVTLRDARARALLGEGRVTEAINVLQARLERSDSSVARARLARFHLASGDTEAARALARDIVADRPESAMAWNLLGEVELARGDEAAALSAFRHLHELYPNSRAYLLGMTSLYASRGEWVTASGYAVQLLRMSEEGRPLSVEYLRRLRDYFRDSGEATRVDQIARDLARRRAEEVAEWRERLRDWAGAPPRPTRRAAPPARPEDDHGQAAGTPPDEEGRPQVHAQEALPSFDEIPTSEEERHTITEAAQRLFGFDALLPGQAETIACMLRGEDVLTILPTGGGKSLCYQLPAMMSCLSGDGDGAPARETGGPGVTLVISPLVALMKDQVDSLPRKVRQRATALNYTLERGELRRRMGGIADGAYRLVYAAPERLRQPPFLHALRNAGVERLVIDEAHCVSMWGHDFRPEYLIIGRVREALGDPPLLAMTATAPLRVRRDILKRLGRPGSSGNGARVVAGDVTRSNLQLEVLQARDNDEKLRHLLAFCKAESGSGIVYGDTRVRCERLAALLRKHGVNAAHYHAGIPDRHRVQDDFMEGRTRVIVATIAFGMGIDKPDIRFIVHFFPPDSLEAYYQEAGRAGRDGLPARCLLMITGPDKGLLTQRARRSLLPVDFLRRVYGCVREQLDGGVEGRIVMADLERSLRADNTEVRVALSLLEEADLLQRGPDVPRRASVRLSAACREDVLPDELRAFCGAARLRPQQPLTVDVIEVAALSGIPLADVEMLLLAWDDDGWIRYRPVGRDILVKVLPAPEDAGDKIERLLERYEKIQIQRVDEISAYARTPACRHGHINAYLGGRQIERCEACDNCVAIAQPPDPGLPPERTQLLTILSCAANAPWSWGRSTLIRILRGEGEGRYGQRDLNEKAVAQAEFGALSFRSKRAIQSMVQRLEDGGFLAGRRLHHSGVVLDLTWKGKKALDNPDFLADICLEELVRPTKEPQRTDSDSHQKTRDVDETLFTALRKWRLDKAREEGIPAFCVFHDSHLKALAAERPSTAEDLLAVHGVGSRKLEKYGSEILALVLEHLRADSLGSEEQRLES